MASEFTKEMGRELVGCMAFCLRSDSPRRLFGWFGLSDAEKLALLTMLKKLLGEETELCRYGWSEEDGRNFHGPDRPKQGTR